MKNLIKRINNISMGNTYIIQELQSTYIGNMRGDAGSQAAINDFGFNKERYDKTFGEDG